MRTKIEIQEQLRAAKQEWDDCSKKQNSKTKARKRTTQEGLALLIRGIQVAAEIKLLEWVLKTENSTPKKRFSRGTSLNT